MQANNSATILPPRRRRGPAPSPPRKVRPLKDLRARMKAVGLTLTDVALEAKVSLPTVSKTLAGLSKSAYIVATAHLLVAARNRRKRADTNGRA